MPLRKSGKLCGKPAAADENTPLSWENAQRQGLFVVQRGKSGMTAKGNGQAERCLGQSRTQSRPVGGTAYRPRPGRGQPTGSKKGTLALKRPTLIAFGEPEGKKKTSGSQGTKGKTEEKGTMTLKRPTLIAFGEPKVKEKASGSQRTGGKTEEIIRWRIGFGTVGRRNRPFPAAADDCPAR